MIRVVLVVALMILMVSSAMAVEDLYLVKVSNSVEVGGLIELEARAVHYGSQGIIILVDTEQSNQLINSGLEYQLLAQSISADRLATEALRSRPHARGLQPIFNEGQFKLYLVEETIAVSAYAARGLHPLQPVLPLENYSFTEPFVGQFASPEDLMDLNTLIGMVSTDSLWSYLMHLQAYPTRVAGTASNRDARDWIKSKLEDFGYLNSRLDTFNVSLSGTPSECYNVIATKTGTKYPDHKVVFGAHFDDVATSPGADDNGSGTSAVLEIARILKDIETDMTIEFVLFDAEEFGLYGAWNHASNSWEAGENIVFMMNQDMIGFIANTTNADVFYGNESQYATRFAQLSDSLVSINVIMQGESAYSDHYPYSQFGIPVAFAAENVFSTVYHTFQDSTSYVSPEYMTKLVKASLATGYWVSQAEGPIPTLEVEYTQIPQFALPEETTEINLTITGIYDGVIVPGSEQIHYQIDDGSYIVEALTNLGDGNYRAVLPALDCGSAFNYYVSVSETTSGTFNFPDPSTPAVLIVGSEYSIDFNDDFETDLGWTTTVAASTGQWQRGVPVNDLSWGYDPITDGDGSGSCFLTQNEMGNTDIDDGSVTLISPVFDYSEGGSIEYDYYLRMTNPAGVDMIVVEGNDGTGWQEITRHTENHGVLWIHNIISEADVTAVSLVTTATFQIRYTASDLTPASIVEAGIDGFKVSHFECVLSCCGRNYAGLTGNTDCSINAIVDLADITQLIDHVYISKLPLCCDENGNTNGDLGGLVNLADITKLIDHVYISKADTEPCL